MCMYRRFLFIVSVSFLFGLFSFQALSAATILYSDNFESGLGNWSNVTIGDNKNWTRDSAGTPSVSTGPATGDASTYYMYLETSSGSAYTAGDTAILQGPTITGTGIHLVFKYHMYGTNMGTLAVDVLSGGSWINNVWSISGQQQTSNAAAYLSADVDLTSYAVSQIRFRATAAGGYMGDMAIDNVQITSEPTGPVAPVFNADPLNKPDAKQNQAYSDSIAADAIDANGDPLSFSKVSGPTWLSVSAAGVLSGTPQAGDVGPNSFVIRVSDGALTNTATLNILVNDNSTPTVLFSDDFELGLGNWTNVSLGDNKDWTRDLAGTTSSSTGPINGADGSVYYMYLETSSGFAYTAGDTAILQGPVITDSNIHFAFKYHMYGSNMGTLAVDVLSAGSWINNVWFISGQQQLSSSAAYTAVDIDLSSYSVSQIRLRATAAGGFMGDMAVDNLQISSHLNPDDLDGDGVLDVVDQCPNTPTNETADSNGCSPSQIDSDNDGVIDINDAFPLDPTEWLDTDVDGIGNNADTDDDADGVLDINDVFPLDATESLDTDGDGIGNNADTDDDNDGVLDVNDTYPLISLGGLTDSDGDGAPNDCDPGCLSLGMDADSDDDNDGVSDALDAFPLNANESLDTDGDLIGNNADTDDDNDGVLDVNDAYPLISLGSLSDTDGDGIPNDCDPGCLGLGMIADTDDDNDGVSDVVDAFPIDPTESVDTDGDLIGNNADTDDDNDGVLDSNDAFPLDPTESIDTDGDGIGNNADTDDDNDGVIDVADAFPLNANESVDTDGDGIGNNADIDDDNDGVLDINDAYPLISLGGLTDSDGDGFPNDCDAACVGLGMIADIDDDNDGVSDAADAFPLDANESLDTDGDLIGNNADTDDDNDGVLDVNDAYPLISLGGLTDSDGDGIPNDCDAACMGLGMIADTDDDNDGVSDVVDAFPLDANESLDTDGDLIGNNADTDDDNDGVLDVDDAYPLISLGGLTDTDGDGIPNDCDAVCMSLGMVADTDDDNDGVSDAVDALPLDATESVDTDGDLIGNNADTDDDNDGVLDINDAFPLDPTESIDTDGDGIGNNADPDDDNDGVSDVADALPLDATESVDTDGDLIGNNADTDDDNDGVLDVDDAYPLISLGGLTDTDGDGIPNDCDAACVSLGMIADTDDDNDGVSDSEEQINGTNPLLADSDSDGWNDGVELACATDGNDILSLPVDSDADQVCNSLDVDSDGDGLIEIHSLEMLNNMRLVLDGHAYSDGSEISSNGCGDGVTVTVCSGYELTSDLDFDDNQNGLRDDLYTSGSGWLPIGTDSQRFTAIFDGNNYEIRNLYINSTSGYVGFISSISQTTIRNLHFKDASINAGVTDYAGILSGSILNSSIENVSVTGEVVAPNVGVVGGLTGSFNGTMNKVYSDVTVVGKDRVGGLVGLNSGALSEVYSIGLVSGNGDHVGGLSGINGAGVTIERCFSAASVSSTGNYTGGLVGLNNGSIFNCYSEGSVDGVSYVGGFLGENNSTGEVRYNISTGAVTASDQYVGGFLGSQVAGTLYPVKYDTDTALQQFGYGAIFTTLQLQAPIDNTGIYSGWDNTVWDFGTSNQYPGIIIDNVTYRDLDSDNDSVDDGLDAFPYDRTETIDTDGDGVGENADLCVSAVVPLSGDNDKDGCDDLTNDNDDDNDGVPDTIDLFPLDATESVDFDGDGIGDNADTDDDNDGFTDAQEQHFSSNPYDAQDKPKIVMSELYTFEGLDIDGLYGLDVADAGDLNGDGYSEIILGAYKVDNYRGRVQVYSGVDGTLMYEILGDDQIDYFGFEVSEAGDVNADGFDDFIVSRYRDNTNNFMSQGYTGEARVYSGLSGQVLHSLFGDAPLGERDQFGYSASGAGDVNNDGYDDIIVGATQDQNGGSYAYGSAQVFSGQDGSVLYKFKGDAAGDIFGQSVAAAGDVNGDGYDDVMVGAPRAEAVGSSRGLVRVFSGFDGTVLFDVYGDADNDELGYSIKSIGDVNNDLVPDLVVGVRYSDAGGVSSGKAKIISGVDGSVIFEVIGAAASDVLGVSVSNIDDVNGDLIPDIAIGSSGNDTTASAAGLAQVVSGIDGTPLFSLYGENADDYFGRAVSGLSDINGDGYGDLIVGAWGYDGAGDKTGKVYVYVTDTDLDSDGVGSLKDAFPLDPTESMDSDGDGVGDNADAFPLDPTESIDSDGDGVGDNADAFPNDPLQS